MNKPVVVDENLCCVNCHKSMREETEYKMTHPQPKKIDLDRFDYEYQTITEAMSNLRVWRDEQ